MAAVTIQTASSGLRQGFDRFLRVLDNFRVQRFVWGLEGVGFQGSGFKVQVLWSRCRVIYAQLRAYGVGMWVRV